MLWKCNSLQFFITASRFDPRVPGQQFPVLSTSHPQILRIRRQNGNFHILHFQSGKTLWWSFQRTFFFVKSAKKWNAGLSNIVDGLKPLNFTIFNALGKKGGWRKQVHLWQVSKASQLQYYLVKILQDNAFFTRSKSPEDSYLQHLHKQSNFGNFKGKNHGLVHEILEESLYLSKALLL